MWSTFWSAVSAIATVGAAVAAWWYVQLTRRLWEATRDQVQMLTKTRETELMQQLMLDYDRLRDSISFIRAYYMDCAASGPTDPFERFKEEMTLNLHGGTISDTNAHNLDDHRHRVSRFFVRTRKLIRGDYLSEDVLVKALDRAAIEDVFLKLVDRLDEAKAGSHYKSDDREFYTDLLQRKYPLSSDDLSESRQVDTLTDTLRDGRRRK